jgi:hypothetical protein
MRDKLQLERVSSRTDGRNEGLRKATRIVTPTAQPKHESQSVTSTSNTQGNRTLYRDKATDIHDGPAVGTL